MTASDSKWAAIADGYAAGIELGVLHLACREPKKRVGNQGPAMWPLLVTAVAIVDATAALPKNASQNRIYNTAAARLGPGLNRDHVRRADEAFWRWFGSLNPELRSTFCKALRHIADEMDSVDRQAVRAKA